MKNSSKINLGDHIKPSNISNPLSGISGIYYLNMDNSTDRRNHIESVLEQPVFNGIPKTRISAISGRDPAFRVEDHFEFYRGAQKNPRMMNTEYATTLSHIKAIHKFVDDVEDMDNVQDDPIALIVEDDMSTEFIPFWKKSLKEYVDELPQNWEILQLSYILFDFTPSTPIESWIMRKNLCGTAAYLIRYSGAKRLISYLCEYSNPSMFRYYIDGKYPIYHHADRFLYSFLTTYSVNPPLFTYRDSNDSAIHPDHISYHANSKERTKKLWLGWDASEAANPHP